MSIIEKNLIFLKGMRLSKRVFRQSLEQCWDEHDQKFKIDNKTSDDFLEYVKSGGKSILSKTELDIEVDKFVKAIKG